MKTIVHNKVPENMKYHDVIKYYHDDAQAKLGDDYLVITNPFDMSIISEKDNIICIGGDAYSYGELEEMLALLSGYIEKDVAEQLKQQRKDIILEKFKPENRVYNTKGGFVDGVGIFFWED